MLRIVALFILISTLTASNVAAQDVMFDEPHASDGAIFLETIDGIETPVDAIGNTIIAHPVFRMTASERAENAWASTISRNPDVSDLRDEVGPTFNLTYLDQVNGNGQGFDHPTLGIQRRAALEAAFAYYAAMLEDYGEADIEIRESFAGNPTSNPFAFSAAYYFGSKGFNSPFTKAHIASGTDPYDAYPDGYLQFNFHVNLNYNYNVNASPSSQEFDFYTIALHEILHMLGFTSYSNDKGESAASENVYTSFDEYLADYNKDVLFEESGSGSSTVVATPDDGTLTNNQVWFELYPGQFAPVFSPSPFNGSSLDHFDNGRSDHGEYVMHPSLSKGDAFKMLHEDEVRVLETLGYSVNYSIATAIEEGFSEGAPINVTSGLYPNPAYTSDPIRIDISKIAGSEILVIVYDMMGKQSYSKVILNRGPGPITAIDPRNNLVPGMYIVVGSSKDELFNEKLVIR
ncbi:MAG: T9SS type A sorting domain-containing protein [Flavobacteriales bacterium]|nr:T9SS type A sorting domain-containing protein [Flavobacteriales bacterium]